MAVANDKWNFIFLAEPRTASRAVRDALLKLDGSYEAGTHHLGIEELLNQKHLRRRKRDRYTTFSTVRNPADIMVTLWLQSSSRKQHNETLAEYIRRWGKTNSLSLTFFFFRHAINADQIIRYENLQEELDTLLQSLRVPTVQLEIVGPTEGKKPWFRYYNIKDLEYMLLNYPEIAQWGYTNAIERQISAKQKKMWEIPNY